MIRILSFRFLLPVFFILIFQGFLTPVAAKNNRSIRFTHLTNDNGLPNNTVYSICQDHKGFIWIATKSGLCKYDGINISVYTHDMGSRNSIPNNQIRYVYEDKQHRLWVATLSGTSLYDRNKDSFITPNKDSLTYFSRIIYQDDDGNVYSAGGHGVSIFNEKTKQFETLVVDSEKGVKGNITSLTSDKNGQLWAGTMFGGLICIDKKNGKISRFRNNQENDQSLISNKIFALYRDSKGRVWIGTEDKGICYYDDIRKKFLSVPDFPSTCVRAFEEDSEGNIWIGSENGLYIYSPETGSLTRSRQDYNDKYSLDDNAIYAIFRDRENNMLIGTYFGGINIQPYAFRQFSYYDYGYSDQYLSGKVVRQILGDKSGNLWIATEDGGLNYYDASKERFEHFRPDRSRNSISYHNVHSLLMDKKNNLWIGTYLGGLNKYDIRTRQFTHYTSTDYPDLYVDNIFSLMEDREGNIWIGTTNGLSVYNPEHNNFRRFEPQTFGSQSVDNIYEDSDGDIWIATRSKGLYCYNKAMKNLQNFSYRPDGKGICDNFINYIFQDSQQNIWIGTHDGGLAKFNKKTEQFTCYTDKDGLPSNTIFGIVESNSGNIWVSTNNGLSCLNVKEGYFTNYSVGEGLPNKQFNYNSVYKDSKGTLYFGTINGMIAFQPENLQPVESTAQVEFTDFKIFGKSIKPEDNNSPLTKNIEEVREIKLNNEQAKSFTFDFTVPTLTHPTNTYYAIKFEKDKDWSYIGSQSHVTFANLPPGEYLLMVKAAFNNKWEGDEFIKSIRIIISPPFWQSSIAYFIYLIGLGGIIIALLLFLQNRQREKNLILSERLEKEKIKEINDLKLNFFTNISHELRTPLSLILIPIQSYLDKQSFRPEMRPKMESVAYNARRMNNLVEELMLFTKVETKKEKIRVKKGDLLGFTRNICEGFTLLAEEKEIAYSIQIPSDRENVWFAPVKVEKIVYNLLSNAFKYTEQGHISVLANLEHEADFTYFRLAITDTGVGIASDEMKKIFENYYQVNDFVKSKKTGFGIGLALTRELVSLHKGFINVESELGKGSTFTIRINVSKEAFASDEISDKDADARFMEGYKFLSVQEEEPGENKGNSPDENQNGKQYSILVVEDNRELLNFYKEMFSDTYTVQTAGDGDEGFQKACDLMPDMILSDVMMPGINGFDFCRKIKSKVETCHIPFILLTAKTGEDAQLEGYNCGADLYVEKPFHPALIRRQISNLISTKENQKKLYLKNKIELKDVVLNDRDKKLISNIEELIKKNLDNDQFSVNDILKELGIGRTLLHVKLKNIVGLSATEFINNVRLKESLKILLAGGNVSEAAYGTGFSSPNYYSRCFKKLFGMSPNEYATKQKE